jgi:uncharacterized protein YecE (DUF72 family)
VREAMANFFAQGVLLLKEKLGPILWQLPPMLRFDQNDPSRFESFFDLLPRDTEAAAELSKEHTDKLKGRAWTKADANRALRYAVEVRHESFLCEPFIALLRRHNIGLCLADTAGIFPYAEDMTADLVYIRLHGAEKLYWSGYSEPQLQWWADRIKLWSKGKEPPDARRVSDGAQRLRRASRDIYVYFDNDAKVRAPWDALSLASKVAPSPMPHRAQELTKRPRVPRKQIEPLRSEWPAVKRARSSSSLSPDTPGEGRVGEGSFRNHE